MKEQPEPPRRYACTYKMRCDSEATTTVVMNGKARAVCESCRNRELREQAAKRDRQAAKEASV